MIYRIPPATAHYSDSPIFQLLTIPTTILHFLTQYSDTTTIPTLLNPLFQTLNIPTDCNDSHNKIEYVYAYIR